MVDDFGSGFHLDEQFDFSVDTTGDLKGDSGINELQKDLAFQMVISLSKYLGNPPSDNLEAKVAATAERVALADSRVRSVRRSSVDVSYSRDRKQLEIEMEVRTLDGEQNLVFEV